MSVPARRGPGSGLRLHRITVDVDHATCDSTDPTGNLLWSLPTHVATQVDHYVEAIPDGYTSRVLLVGTREVRRWVTAWSAGRAAATPSALSAVRLPRLPAAG